MSEVQITVRWSDMDAYGHVNNGVYLNYLEEARDRLAGELHTRLRYARIDKIFEVGLAKFLGGVRDDIATLSDEIGSQFLLD